MNIIEPITLTELQNSTENLEILAHDLRSPLNSISGLVGILKLELGDFPNENALRCLELIEQNCRHSHELLNKVLEFVRLEENTQHLSKEESDLVEIIHHLIELHQISAKEKGVSLSFTYGKENLMACVDKIYFSHAVENLLSNAIKFTQNKGSVNIILYDSDEHIYLKVIDNGIGIGEEEILHVFDRFTKIRRNGLRGEESVGLGMSITKQIILAHSGEITVKSQLQKGTTFSICLPKC